MTARLLSALTAFALLASTTHAAQVLWGSARLATNYMSSGAPNTLNSEFTFQLGAFESGFTPTPDNTAEWLAHWVPAQSVGYNERTRFFTGSFVFQESTAPFTPNNQAYIFGFNRWAASEGTNQAEWILVTDPNWRWPAIGGITPPVQWSMTNASDVILGKVNAPGSSSHMQTSAVSTPLESLSLDFWSKRYAIGADAVSLAADNDGDGLSNLLEYALSTSPVDSSDVRVPYVDVIPENNMLYTEISFFKFGLIDEASLIPQMSSDMISWEAAADDFDILEDSVLIYRIRSKTPVMAGDARFYRLEASLNP